MNIPNTQDSTAPSFAWGEDTADSAEKIEFAIEDWLVSRLEDLGDPPVDDRGTEYDIFVRVTLVAREPVQT